MTKINQEEYYVLKSLEDQWEWIARDSWGNHGGNLFAYSDKPAKDYEVGVGFLGRGIRSIDNHLFQFIQWEDEEPCSIAELIEGYESEGTEVKKNKEWAQKEVDRYLSYEGVNEARNALAFAKGVINQLDEQEGLEAKIQELIEVYKREDGAYSNPENGWIGGFIEDLENLVEEEQEKVEVPQFVFDWIKECKEFNVLEEIFYLEGSLSSQNMRKEHELYFWLKKNFDTFAKAWIAYPNIKGDGEQKYYVLNSESETMIRKSDSRVRTSSGFKIKNGFKSDDYKFTEQEIKDYDERYWPFRRKVEELETND